VFIERNPNGLNIFREDDSKITYKETEPFTTKIKKPDSTKAKRDLKFKVEVKPEEGIPKTIEWFRRVYGR